MSESGRPARSHAPTPVGVMISGGGRTLMNLARAMDEGRLNARIAVVVASRECPGAARARQRGLTVMIEPGEIPAEKLDDIMSGAGVEWIVLGGYLHRVKIPERFRGRVVNIHPALLPRFGGPGMYGDRVHRAVLQSGADSSGCTVHLCDDEYDQGPIVAQRSCDVLPDDTPQTLAERVFELECELYPEALADLFEGKVQPPNARVRMGEA